MGNDPIWRAYFSNGWLNHQLVIFSKFFTATVLWVLTASGAVATSFGNNKDRSWRSFWWIFNGEHGEFPPNPSNLLLGCLSLRSLKELTLSQMTSLNEPPPPKKKYIYIQYIIYIHRYVVRTFLIKELGWFSWLLPRMVAPQRSKSEDESWIPFKKMNDAGWEYTHTYIYIHTYRHIYIIQKYHFQFTTCLLFEDEPAFFLTILDPLLRRMMWTTLSCLLWTVHLCKWDEPHSHVQHFNFSIGWW